MERHLVSVIEEQVVGPVLVVPAVLGLVLPPELDLRQVEEQVDSSRHSPLRRDRSLCDLGVSPSFDFIEVALSVVLGLAQTPIRACLGPAGVARLGNLLDDLAVPGIGSCVN